MPFRKVEQALETMLKSINDLFVAAHRRCVKALSRFQTSDVGAGSASAPPKVLSVANAGKIPKKLGTKVSTSFNNINEVT